MENQVSGEFMKYLGVVEVTKEEQQGMRTLQDQLLFLAQKWGEASNRPASRALVTFLEQGTPADQEQQMSALINFSVNAILNLPQVQMIVVRAMVEANAQVGALFGPTQGEA